MPVRLVRYSLALLAALTAVPRLPAQVTMYPATTNPAAWERFALRVVNQTDTATVAVRLMVPDGVQVLGVDAPPGWTFRHEASTATTPQAIEWSGTGLGRGEFREFAFLGRVVGDARAGELVFPMRITRANGATVEWGRRGAGQAPLVRIEGVAVVSASGATAMAGAALGLAALAVGLALLNRRARG